MYTTIQDYNATGMAGIFLYVADVVPAFIPLVLFGLFMIVALGTYFSQLRLRGSGNFWVSFAVAGYMTLIVAFIMNLIPNLINAYTIIICLVVAMIGTILLLVTKEKY